MDSMRAGVAWGCSLSNTCSLLEKQPFHELRRCPADVGHGTARMVIYATDTAPRPIQGFKDAAIMQTRSTGYRAEDQVERD